MFQSRINRVYGFYDEAVRRFGQRKGKKLWVMFHEAFDSMPTSALVQRRLFCMHGGLSPFIVSFEQLRRWTKPLPNPIQGIIVSIIIIYPQKQYKCVWGVISDLMWSDPSLEVGAGWKDSTRGTAFFFGPDVVTSFCQKFDLDMVVRAHQVCLDGYWFFADKKMVRATFEN